MRVTAGLLWAALLCAAQDWRTAAELPGVNWTGVTAAQKERALKVIREYGCTCGCQMKVAQCRVEDPPCGQSRALAELAVAAARQGKPEAEIRQALDNSNLARQAKQRNRILLDPVAIPIAGAPAKGPADARVTLVEFSDFQCPYCATAVANLNAVMQAYPNDVRLVFKQFPLEIHSNAALAAAAALAAHAQGKFWPLHDRMYAEYRRINRASILAWARQLGIEPAKFAADLDAPRTLAAVERDMKDGVQAGVSGTPTVFVNGKKYQGALDPASLRTVIAAELQLPSK